MSDVVDIVNPLPLFAVHVIAVAAALQVIPLPSAAPKRDIDPAGSVFAGPVGWNPLVFTIVPSEVSATNAENPLEAVSQVTLFELPLIKPPAQEMVPDGSLNC